MLNTIFEYLFEVLSLPRVSVVPTGTSNTGREPATVEWILDES